MKKRVQCISTSCGFHKHLKLLEWYDLEERSWNDWNRNRITSDTNQISNVVINHYYENKYGVEVVEQLVYDKSLFRTIDERRDKKIRQILDGE